MATHGSADLQGRAGKPPSELVVGGPLAPRKECVEVGAERAGLGREPSVRTRTARMPGGPWCKKQGRDRSWQEAWAQTWVLSGESKAGTGKGLGKLRQR